MKTIQFPRWAEVLETSNLPEQTLESYKVTLRWYLSWCHRHSVGCSVESARDFIDWAQREKQANDWMVERWREAIRWFFRMAKAQALGNIETLKAENLKEGAMGSGSAQSESAPEPPGSGKPTTPPSLGGEFDASSIGNEESRSAGSGQSRRPAFPRGVYASVNESLW